MRYCVLDVEGGVDGKERKGYERKGKESCGYRHDWLIGLGDGSPCRCQSCCCSVCTHALSHGLS